MPPFPSPLPALPAVVRNWVTLVGACRTESDSQGVYDRETMPPDDCRGACEASPSCLAFETSPRDRCELHWAPVSHADTGRSAYRCTVASATQSPTPPSSPPPPSPVLATCSAHAACSSLQGECCPTAGGTMLECCAAFPPAPNMLSSVASAGGDGFSTHGSARYGEGTGTTIRVVGEGFDGAHGCCPDFDVSVHDAWQGGFKLLLRASPWITDRVLLLELPSLGVDPPHTRLEVHYGQMWNAEQLWPRPDDDDDAGGGADSSDGADSARASAAFELKGGAHDGDRGGGLVGRLDLTHGTTLRLTGSRGHEMGFVVRYDWRSVLYGSFEGARVTCLPAPLAIPPSPPAPPSEPSPPRPPPFPPGKAPAPRSDGGNGRISEVGGTGKSLGAAGASTGAALLLTFGLIALFSALLVLWWRRGGKLRLVAVRRKPRRTLASGDAAAAAEAIAAMDDDASDTPDLLEAEDSGALPSQSKEEACRRSSTLSERISAVVELELPGPADANPARPPPPVPGD